MKEKKENIRNIKRLGKNEMGEVSKTKTNRRDDQQEINRVIEKIELLKKMEAVDSDAALKKIKVRINRKRGLNFMVIMQRAAAVLILPLLIFSLWQSTRLSQINDSIVVNEITTPPTMRSEFTLPDGTRVWVNGGSSIIYPTQFTGNERLVELNGEAYFEVAPDRNKPFLVKAGNLYVEAVGTAFNCMAFAGDSHIETVLTDGEVNILYDYAGVRRKITTLQPGQMASYDTENGKFSRRIVDTYKYTAWIDGKIVFRNDYLSDVLKRLERWYNVEFVYDTELKSAYAFTGTFFHEELSQILGYIELTTPVEFDIQKRIIDNEQTIKQTQIKIKQK